jgi:uncharacterized protein (TIGR00255 family)
MLMSMTGFARRSGEAMDLRWVCEVKSLNGRGLDIRCRLPPSFDALEAAVRTLVQERFARGTIHVNLSLERVNGGAQLRLNREILDQVLRIAAELESLRGVAPARLDGLLALKGVLDIGEAHDGEKELALREAALLQGTADTLDGLKSARKSEGGHLSKVIEGHIGRIAQLSSDARRLVAGLHDTIRGRIKTQVATLLEASNNTLDPARLAQETALIFARGDVTEELDRLDAHVAQARQLAASGEPAGRRFEFLAQEFNREANTLCSKSISVELTRLGLDLKTVIDQFREQIQNVE